MNNFVENEWIIPGNISDYNHVEAFNSQKVITWGLKLKNIKVGDFAYIYSSAPYSGIRYKCIVERVDIKEDEWLGDEFWLQPFVHNLGMRYINIKLISEFHDDFRLKLRFLKNNGFLNNPPQRSGRIRQKLSELLNSI